MMEAVRVTGRAGHSSNPALGNSALEGMHAVMGDHELSRRAARALQQRAVHRGHPTLNLGCVHGGDSPNRICGRAELHFDLRMTPGGDNETLRGEIAERLAGIARQHDLEIELRSLVHDIAPFEQAADSGWCA